MKCNEGLYFTRLLPLWYSAKENNFVLKDSQTALPKAWSHSNMVSLQLGDVGRTFSFLFSKGRGGEGGWYRGK